MKAYKLVRKLKDGSIAPLFINKKKRLPLNEWMFAESHPTKGFAYRQGWHCTLSPVTPHLKMELKSGEKRVWVEVEVKGIKYYNRPESQGGTWVLAQQMRIIGELPVQIEVGEM